MENLGTKKTLLFPIKGSLVVVNNRHDKRKAWTKSKTWKVIDIEYIMEILDKNNRFLSTLPGTIGNCSIELTEIKSKSLGLFIGSIYLWDYAVEQSPETYGVILMEKSVYLVESRCVSLVSKPIPLEKKI